MPNFVPFLKIISILPAIGKLLETIVSKQIWQYMQNNDLLTIHQHAYRSGHSLATALVDMIDVQMDKGNTAGALNIEFSAAFDLVDHDTLVGKLSHYGFQETALNWVKSYLNDRMRFSFINGSLSFSHRVMCGVSQGSRLYPLLYLIYINDFPHTLSK